MRTISAPRSNYISGVASKLSSRSLDDLMIAFGTGGAGQNHAYGLGRRIPWPFCLQDCSKIGDWSPSAFSSG